MTSTQSDTIRSHRDFLRRYMPRRYREKYIAGRPPSSCPKCRISLNWSRARWGAWLCKDCGTFVRDEERS